LISEKVTCWLFNSGDIYTKMWCTWTIDQSLAVLCCADTAPIRHYDQQIKLFCGRTVPE